MGFIQLQQKVLLLQILFVTSECLHLKSADQDRKEILKTVITEVELVKKSCPPWKYNNMEYNSSCVCGHKIYNNVLCEDDQPTVELLTCHCMSYSEKGESDNMLVMGNCPYLCTNDVYTKIHNHEDISDLCNKEIQQNRQGQMCGKCQENFAPFPYSYTFECTECSNYKNNWLKYLLIAFLPLTIFFLVAVIFRFNAMSPSLNSYILICQLVGCHAVMSIFSIYIKFSQHPPANPNLKITLVIKFLSFIYGIWNLDFFRIMYKPFCLHPNLSILQILSLDYSIAVYPLFLICITYFLIKFHDRFEVVQYLWKPARWFITRINQKWRTSNSLIEAFGTFLLLSYVKIINTSFDILMPVQLYNVSGKVVGLYVYYNGSMEYFGSDHLPYAMLAIFMFVTFNLMPLLLLCLYPCRCFQSCLNFCRLNSQVLRTFMDAFQGYYKFEPHDYRYWAAFYLFLRIAILSIFGFTQSGYFLLVTGILLVPVASLLAVVRPYRENIYNVIDMIMIITLVQTLFSAVGYSLTHFDRRYDRFINVMIGSGLLIPHTYAAVKLLMHILPSRLVEVTKEHLQNVSRKVKHALIGRKNLEESLLRDHAGSVGEQSENSHLLARERVITYNS